MSIVLDALNKAEKDHQKHKPKVSGEHGSGTPGRFQKPIVMILVFNVFLVLLLLSGGIWFFLNQKVNDLSTSESDQELKVAESIQSSGEDKKSIEVSKPPPVADIDPVTVNAKPVSVAKKEEPEVIIKKNFLSIRGFGSISVKGVISDPKGSSVLIDEEMIFEGEEINGFIVKEILKKKIIFEHQGKEYAVKT